MPVNHRVYPLGSLAAHIIGGVGKEQIGQEGVEMKFDEVLDGEDGSQRVLKDAKRRAIGVAAEDYIPPRARPAPGADDRREHPDHRRAGARGGCEQFKAKRGEVVVMDPWTGEVLALGELPDASTRRTSTTPTPDVRRNSALVAPYEPGSAIKPFIVGPAFAGRHHARPDLAHRRDLVDDALWPTSHRRAWLRPADDLGRAGEVEQHRHVDAGRADGEPGACTSALTSFGFGKPTGIELPGEDPGLIRAARSMEQALDRLRRAGL